MVCRTSLLQDTLQEWSTYYSKIGEDDCDDLFDQQFFDQTNDSVDNTPLIPPASSPPLAPQHPAARRAGGSKGVMNSKPISRDEVVAAVNGAMAGKARDPDGFLNEWFKYGGDSMIDSLHVLFDEVWRAAYVPSGWLMALIHPLYKGSGPKDRFDSYRPIAIISSVYKIFECIPHSRLRSFIDPPPPPPPPSPALPPRLPLFRSAALGSVDGFVGGSGGAMVAAAERAHERYLRAHGSFRQLANAQFGFRSGRSCADAQFILNEVINYRREQGLPTVVAFIDAKQAYDRVWRNGVWHMLMNAYRGIDQHLIGICRALYRSVRAKVMVNGVHSPAFATLQGLWQGSKLSPLLFILLFSLLCRELDRNPRCGVTLSAPPLPPIPVSFSTPLPPLIPPNVDSILNPFNVSLLVRISSLLFADDVGFVSESEAGMQLSLSILEAFFRRIRFIVNHPKSGVMVFGPAACLRSSSSALSSVSSSSPSSALPAPVAVVSAPSGSGPAGGLVGDEKKGVFVIQGRALPLTKSYRYLGVIMQSNMSWQQYSDSAIKRARGALATLHYVGARQGGLRYSTGRHLINGMVYPIMTWSSEVIDFTRSQLQQQQVIQSSAIRQLLGVDRSCNNVIARGESAMLPLSSVNDRSQLRFLYHLISGLKIGLLSSLVFRLRFRQFQLQQLHRLHWVLQRPRSAAVPSLSLLSWGTPLLSRLGEGLVPLLGSLPPSFFASSSPVRARSLGLEVNRDTTIKQYGYCSMIDALVVKLNSPKLKELWMDCCSRVSTASRHNSGSWMGVVDRSIKHYYVKEWRNDLHQLVINGSAAARFWLFCSPHLDFSLPLYLSTSLTPTRTSNHSHCSYRARLLRAQLRTSTAPLAALIARHHWSTRRTTVFSSSGGSGGSGRCEFCSMGVVEDQAHFLCECPLHHSDRIQLFAMIEKRWDFIDWVFDESNHNHHHTGGSTSGSGRSSSNGVGMDDDHDEDVVIIESDDDDRPSSSPSPSPSPSSSSSSSSSPSSPGGVAVVGRRPPWWLNCTSLYNVVHWRQMDNYQRATWLLSNDFIKWGGPHRIIDNHISLSGLSLLFDNFITRSFDRRSAFAKSLSQLQHRLS